MRALVTSFHPEIERFTQEGVWWKLISDIDLCKANIYWDENMAIVPESDFISDLSEMLDYYTSGQKLERMTMRRCSADITELLVKQEAMGYLFRGNMYSFFEHKPDMILLPDDGYDVVSSHTDIIL